MNEEELKKKIGQIEDQAREALADFPNLAKERLRMIQAVARYISTELSHFPEASDRHPVADDEDPRAHPR